MTAEKRTRRKYTEDFKRDAVALITEQGYKIAEAARSLGIGGDLIRRWKREFDVYDISGENVLLIDDLYRSGATLSVATEMLYEKAGVEDVFVLTMTKTRSNR